VGVVSRRKPQPDDLLVVPNWEAYLPYVRISRDRKRQRLPQVVLHVSEALDTFEGLDAAERGALVTLLLEYASCPLVGEAADRSATDG
jgi:hypothetical protein